MGLADWLSKQIVELQGQSPLLTDPYYRLRSPDEVRLAAQLGVAIDVNQAGIDDWLRLPGISIHQARSLVSLVQSGVPLHCLEDVAAALGIPVQRLKPLEPVLQFNYYDPASPTTIRPVNANTASIEMLARVPGIDLYLAGAIAQNRKTHGRFQNLAQLQQRLQLSPQQTAALLHFLCF